MRNPGDVHIKFLTNTDMDTWTSDFIISISVILRCKT